MEFEWSTYTDYISRFGLDLANDLVGMSTHNTAHEQNISDMDCSSPDISWGTGFNHFGGDGCA
jgi:hypothetical protein